MPRDLAGNYTLPLGNPVVADTLITPAWANSTMSDVATQLNGVVTRDGKLGMLQPFPVQPGAVATPGLTFVGDTTTGLYQTAAGRIGFTISGVNVATITPTSFTFSTACMPAVAADPVSANQLARKSYVDTAVATGGGAYVPLSGGTMTGNLGISKSAPSITFDEPAAGNSGLYWRRASVARWYLLNYGAEAGSNSGSDIKFFSRDDSGTALDVPLTLKRSDSSALFTGIVTAAGFVGPLTGDVTGDVTGNVTGNVTGALIGNVTGSATSLAVIRNINGVGFNGTASITVPANIQTDATNTSRNVIFSGGTGNQQLYADDGILYNPSTNTLTVSNFAGNAATATALATARTFNGTSFNGTANITVPTNIQADATDVSRYVLFSAGSGNTQTYADTGGGLTYNPATNVLSADEMVVTAAASTDDYSVGYKKIARSSSTTISRLYCGFCKSLSAGVTIPSATFEAGDSFSIFNNSASVFTITQGSGLTMYGPNASTGSVSLAARGMATIWFDSPTVCKIVGEVS